MTPGYTLVTGPLLEPISIDEAKKQARISDSASNDLLRSYITTAREAAEASLGYGLYTQTWKLVLDGFSESIELPLALQLQTITSVQYYDPDGNIQTLSSSYYLLDQMSRPGRIVRAPNVSWPSVQADRLSGVVIITYVVGWTSVDLIPQRIKQGIRLYVTYLDLDRDGLEQGPSTRDVGLQAALNAAEACWTDKLYWTPPRRWSAVHGWSHT